MTGIGILVRAAARTGKPIIMSTGMADLSDIELALETIRGEGNRSVALLQCAISYPPRYEDLHLRAMTDPAAKGERFLAVAGDPMTMQQIAQLLKARMGDAASRVPTRELPDWVVRLASLVVPALKQVVPELDAVKNTTNAKARHVLGWAPRSNEDAIIATAESLVRLGLLRKSKQTA